MPLNITGHTGSTKNRLLLNAGAFFKNFHLGTDTYESAMKAGKCLGATQGGGNFAAVPTMRETPIDGADPEQIIDDWKVTISAKIIEVTPETLKMSLGTGVIQSEGDEYYVVRAKRMISNSDYIDNITWCGTLSGSNEPVIIQIYNAINTSGLTINVAPKSQSVIDVTFAAKADPDKRPDDRDFAPFSIYYPKSLAAIEIDPVFDLDTKVTGKGITGATVYITGGDIPPTASGIVAATGVFSIDIPEQPSGTQITGYQTLKGIRSLDAVVYVEVKIGTLSNEVEVE